MCALNCPTIQRCLSLLQNRFGHNGCKRLKFHPKEHCISRNWRGKTSPFKVLLNNTLDVHRLVFILSKQLAISLDAQKIESRNFVRNESSWEDLEETFNFLPIRQNSFYSGNENMRATSIEKLITSLSSAVFCGWRRHIGFFKNFRYITFAT